MNSPVSLILGKTCNVFKATIGKSHKYINVSERLLYKSQRESSVPCWLWLIQSEGRRADPSSGQANSMKINSAAPLWC